MERGSILSGPFALVGASVGLVIGQSGSLPAVALGAALPVLMWKVGQRASSHPNAWWRFVIGLGASYGALLFLFFDREPYALLRGAICGATLAFAGLLPLSVFTIAARDANEARAGSLADRSERRSVWAAGLLPFDLVGVLIAMRPLFIAIRTRDEPDALTYAAFGWMVGSKLWFWVADRWLLRKLERVDGEARQLRFLTSASRSRGEIDWIDLGVGDELRGSLDATAASYREAPAPTRVVAGDLRLSVAVVRRNLAQLRTLVLILYAPALLALFVCALSYLASRVPY
jgi:hypothetical protein